MIDYLSQSAVTAYIDLRRMLMDEAVSDIRGTPTRVTVGDKLYWYDKYRVGADIAQRYIGEDNAQLRDRLERHRELAETRKARDAERTRLVRLLRAEGMSPMGAQFGSFVGALARTGVFRLGGTIVGTNAFALYEGELGIRIGTDAAARTQDLDIASFERLSLALGDRVEADTSETLRDLDFEPVPSLRPGRVWRWKQTRRETLVEFLTPAFGDETIRDLPALGVSAQALHYLNFLIARPVKAVALYRSGVLVQIPRPEAFAIHKLIVADRRREGQDQLKSRKDRAQAALLVEVLAEDRPDELAEAWHDAMGRGPNWRKRIGASLARMPETKAILEALPG